MQEENSELSVCLSFSSYSSDGLTDIAAQVTREFGGLGDWRRQVGDDFRGEDFGELDNEDDFEFVSVSKADDVVVLDGQFGPVFPIFNRDLPVPEKIQLQTNFAHDPKEEEGHDALSLRLPLKKLFVEESDPSPRFSTSSEEDVEADQLNGVPPGTYCIWTPNNNSNNNSAKASPSNIKCKKSSSTGTGSSSASKRWRLLSLLRRCNSEGKDTLVFLTPKKEEIIKAEKTDSKEKKVKKAARETMSSAHEVFYVRNRAMKEGDKRRTYLPYRQDLVGFWTSVGTLGRSLPPF